MLSQTVPRKSDRNRVIVQRYTNGSFGADRTWRNDVPQRYIPVPDAIDVPTITALDGDVDDGDDGDHDGASGTLSTDSVVSELFGGSDPAPVSVGRSAINDCCCNNREDHMFHVARHNFESRVWDWNRSDNGKPSTARFNLLLKKVEALKSWNLGHTISLNKAMKSKLIKLEVFSEYLVVTIIPELRSVKTDMRQMLILLASLREVDEDHSNAIRNDHHDVMVHIAAKCFLASKELVQMSRSSDDEDVGMRFLSLLNKWLKEESWNPCKFLEGCLYRPRRDLDEMIQLPNRSLLELKKGYLNIKYSIDQARESQSKHRNGEHGQFDAEMIEFVKQNSIDYIKRTKNDIVEIAVQVAAAGNTLMMLVHGDSFDDVGLWGQFRKQRLGVCMYIWGWRSYMVQISCGWCV
ncbi:hypothetical protein FRACYDRAFT_241419 [Fragilariopsis cylindrus CCMP1102]|uniref:Uncharacterized protein n=1 Tax=Fragilariopsis cylindrus CCMP1102 TaxID=635003 RepID=A0A1E7F9L4_9STRA|nr:hypothetical protein FRACYDRAFT_241419 [Fragilariopsis cylindrus CCMP1102]|eukprot:OEU14862.1 hypothetical protein FRACYDRAFT_241419 [Fragilariopsis cylindrus CCMP1102]